MSNDSYLDTFNYNMTLHLVDVQGFNESCIYVLFIYRALAEEIGR